MSNELSTITQEIIFEQFTVVFRHPARHDPISGAKGRRVRRLMGTSDPDEANSLQQQLDQLLSDEQYWTPDARPGASTVFDPRVVSLFFDGMAPRSADASAVLREAQIPLPTKTDGYRRVLLVGTTGAGKTTVIRQLLGTDPDRDRFPSTSTAKTTVADTEIVVAEGVYKAIVTFFPRDEIVDHLTDCASRTAQTTLRGVEESELRTMLLDHENQRFRFSYVLGRDAPKKVHKDTIDDEFSDFDAVESTAPAGSSFTSEPPPLGDVDPDDTHVLISSVLATLRTIANELSKTLSLDQQGLNADRAAENLDQELRFDPRFNSIIDALVDEIEKRFDSVSVGTINRNAETWPATWTYESRDRTRFLQAVNRFTSNYAPLFGHLLTPMVDGIRVTGPFRPTWVEGPLPKLVLVDGEGLGHTAKSSASLPTKVALLINQVDAVVLVDNAQQPMQAAPAAAIRSIITSGNVEKLAFCFTHFEEVQGDNLASLRDRAHHVLASVENLLSGIRADFGERPEEALRYRLEKHRVFLSSIDKRLNSASSDGSWSIKQFELLLKRLHEPGETAKPGPSTPAYDRKAITDAIEHATGEFHDRWRALLGTRPSETIPAENWTRIKALSKRFATGTADFYDTLRPNADLRELLKEDIYRTLENTLEWVGPAPTDSAEKTLAVDHFSNAIARRLEAPIRERLSVLPQKDWRTSFSFSGDRSTSLRAKHISEKILDRNIEVARSKGWDEPDTFVNTIASIIEEAANEVGVTLR